MSAPNFCGCCGRQIEQGTTDWCMDCLREHIDTLAARREDATFFAQYHTDCPFQVGSPLSEKT